MLLTIQLHRVYLPREKCAEHEVLEMELHDGRWVGAAPGAQQAGAMPRRTAR